MAWTPAQDAAFNSGVGPFATASGVLLVFASIVIVFFVLWVAWVGFAVFDRWRSGGLEWGEFAWYLVRASMILMVVGYFIR
jgi:integrating conjugative element protein (TIGR03758 family)